MHLIHRMLAKQPEDRPASAQAVADELKELQQRHFPSYHPGGAPDWSLADSSEIVRHPELGETSESDG